MPSCLPGAPGVDLGADPGPQGVTWEGGLDAVEAETGSSGCRWTVG